MKPLPTPFQDPGRILSLPTKETILVVDDHPALCEVAKILLGRCGYHVLCANGAERAKALALQNPKIDLLLTDIEMPGVSGDELAEWFRGVNPQTAIVFMSGNPMHRLRLKEYPFIEKPFVHLDLLVRTIRETLARNSAVTHSASAAAA